MRQKFSTCRYRLSKMRPQNKKVVLLSIFLTADQGEMLQEAAALSFRRQAATSNFSSNQLSHPSLLSGSLIALILNWKYCRMATFTLSPKPPPSSQLTPATTGGLPLTPFCFHSSWIVLLSGWVEMVNF